MNPFRTVRAKTAKTKTARIAAIRIAFRPIAGPCAGRARVARVWRLADPFDMAHLPSQAAPVLYARAPEVLWDLSIAPVRSMDDKTGFRRVENPPSHLTPSHLTPAR